MRVRRLLIEKFRWVKSGSVDFVGHTLLVGGNNIGKSTVCEGFYLALDPNVSIGRG
jgi:putative ATP-dependent endonuclease of OLD family